MIYQQNRIILILKEIPAIAIGKMIKYDELVWYHVQTVLTFRRTL